MAPASLSAEDVQDILRLLDTLPFDELTLETSHFTLRLQRAADGGWAQETHVPSRPVATGSVALAQPAPPTEPAPPAEPPPAAEAPPVAEPTPAGTGPGRDLREVRAPLLGTFYRAPQPGAPPYVEVGSLVAPDTVVAIIETMKLMNPVYAGTAGTVSEICLDDGQFAEQDAVLMRVSERAR
jgi:acetyl-CoA carboxylase biotin carboxyl carrier protein